MFLGLSLAMWVEWFRMMRATAAAIVGSRPVEAVRLLGFGTRHILRRHVPQPLMPLAVWCLMMTESLPYYADLPMAMIAPGVCLTLLLLGLQLIAGRRGA